MPDSRLLVTALAGHYEIVRELGAGGMATVYLARDRKHEREVALKVLRPELGAVLGADRFLAEIKITARLDHPHILTLIDSGAAEGFLYYVLPYVRGESLRDKLNREQQLGLEEALLITRQVASALDYAHRQGVVHRDIKPENILLQEGEAMLADFGIALAVKEAGGNRLTETGLSLGTPQYMSPEQATGDRQLDARSDVYSLAAVLYEMLAGEPPVTGPTAQAMIAKLMTEKPTRLQVVRDTITGEIDAAVAKALSKTPADRYASAGDFARALEVRPGTAAHIAAAPNRARGPLVAVGVAVVAVAVTLGVLVATGKLGRRNAAFVLRDRTQLTASGNVQQAAISPDGKQLAYFTKTCTESACTYAAEVQDVGGTTTRRILDGATAAYGLSWSPDRRNLLVLATIGGRWGVYLLSALGGPPRYLTSGVAAFWAGGDSLLVGPPFHPDSVFFLHVTSLAGSGRDSIRVAGPGADQLVSATVSPGGRWIVVELEQAAHGVWQVMDRSGKVASRWSGSSFSSGMLTRDALWRASDAAGGDGAVIVRQAFDEASGQLGAKADTVLSGRQQSFSLPADGSSLIVDEGSGDYSVWALDFADALRGRFPAARRVLRSTTPAGARVSPDGVHLLVWRLLPSADGASEVHLSIMPFDGGVETPLGVGGSPVQWGWADATTVGISTHTARGLHLALVDVHSGAERNGLDLADSSITDFTPLPDGWAWIPSGGEQVLVERAGRRTEIARPAWFGLLTSIGADSAGHRVVFTGWNVSTFDSLGVAVAPLDGGAPEKWAAMFAEAGFGVLLPDGSVALEAFPTEESAALYHLRGAGRVERLGLIPRPVAGLGFSSDLKRVSVVTRDYQGDVWSYRIARQ